MSVDDLRVAPDKLTRICNVKDLGFETPDEDGGYTEGTVHHLVKRRFAKLAASARSYSEDGDDQAGNRLDEDS